MWSGGCSQHSNPDSDRNSGDAGRKTGRLLDRMASDDQLGSVGANRCPLAPSFLCHFPLLVFYPSPAPGWRRRRWQLGSGRAAGASDRAMCRLGGGSQVAAAGRCRCTGADAAGDAATSAAEESASRAAEKERVCVCACVLPPTRRVLVRCQWPKSGGGGGGGGVWIMKKNSAWRKKYTT